jgi:hypothetical protein
VIDVPETVRYLRLHRPWLNGGHTESVRLAGNPIPHAEQEQLIPVLPGQPTVVESIMSGGHFTHVPPSRSRLWAVARRQLCELRDRLRPGIDRVKGARPSVQPEAERMMPRNST